MKLYLWQCFPLDASRRQYVLIDAKSAREIIVKYPSLKFPYVVSNMVIFHISVISNPFLTLSVAKAYINQRNQLQNLV